MNSRLPTTVKDLFSFYYDTVKPLYAVAMTSTTPPIELFFESLAALDHLSRHWQFDEPEEHAVREAYSHLMRSCYDVFKIQFSETYDQFKELRKIDTSYIEGGEYDRKMRLAFGNLRQKVLAARNAEGSSGSSVEEHAYVFDAWAKVFKGCVEFEQDFYLNPQVGRAWKTKIIYQAARSLIAVVIGFVAASSLFPLVGSGSMVEALSPASYQVFWWAQYF